MVGNTEGHIIFWKSEDIHINLASTLEHHSTHEKAFGDFPGGPVVKTPCSQCWRHGFNPWSSEVGSNMPCGMAKILKEIKKHTHTSGFKMEDCG